MADNQHGGEIIGSHNPANGQSCNQCDCCRNHLLAGELVQFKGGAIWVLSGNLSLRQKLAST
jgi:hypothetical protein